MTRFLTLAALCFLPALSSAQILYEIDFKTSEDFNSGMDFRGHVRKDQNYFFKSQKVNICKSLMPQLLGVSRCILSWFSNIHIPQPFLLGQCWDLQRQFCNLFDLRPWCFWEHIWGRSHRRLYWWWPAELPGFLCTKLWCALGPPNPQRGRLLEAAIHEALFWHLYHWVSHQSLHWQ